MNDIKLQVWRGTTPVEEFDFRGDKLKGSPDDEHRTVAEVPNADADFVDLLTNPARLAELVQQGDTVASVVNRVLGRLVEQQDDAFGQVASLLRLGGSGDVNLGIRVYDHD